MAELIGGIVGGIVWGHVIARALSWAGIKHAAAILALVFASVLVLARVARGFLIYPDLIMTTAAICTAYLTIRSARIDPDSAFSDPTAGRRKAGSSKRR